MTTQTTPSDEFPGDNAAAVTVADTRTDSQKAADEKKKIPALYRFAHAAHDSLALKIVAYTMGFLAADAAIIGYAVHGVKKEEKVALVRAEEAAKKHNGMVTMYDTYKYGGSSSRYIPAEGESITMPLAEAKEEIVNPKHEKPATPWELAELIGCMAFIGVVGAGAGKSLLNGAAELGMTEYHRRAWKIDRKYGFDY